LCNVLSGLRGRDTLNILRANSVTNVSEAIYANALCLDRLLAYKAI
jgi:hypothetical protein